MGGKIDWEGAQGHEGNATLQDVESHNKTQEDIITR